MKITGIQIAEGYVIPWWCGIAYYSPCSDHSICYPIPINLIVRFGRSAWWAMKSGKSDALSKAYNAGRKSGATDLRSYERKQNQRVAEVLRMARHE